MSWRGGTAVPEVVGDPLNRATASLVHRRLLVSVPDFPRFRGDELPEQGYGQLADYRVSSQSIAAGTAVHARTVVTLAVDLQPFRGPIGSMGVPGNHPKFVRIANLVGDDYSQAMSVGSGFRSGIWVAVGRTGPLTPSASACGLDGFAVIAQYPRAGTRVLWGGVNPEGVDPRLATVVIRLASRTG